MTRWMSRRARAVWRESPDSLKGQAARDTTIRRELLRFAVCPLATLAWCALLTLLVA